VVDHKLFDGGTISLTAMCVNSIINLRENLDHAKAEGLGREKTNALVKLFERIAQVEIRRTI
jgi:hypothetical protein